MTKLKAPARPKKASARTKSPAPDGSPANEHADVSDLAKVSVTFRPLKDLKDYARNARTHPEAQIEQLAAIIDRLGFAGAILVDSQGIVAGHGRKMALASLYAAGKTVRMAGGGEIPTGMAPTIDVTGWSEADRKAFIIADNRIAENAGWDQKLLALDMTDLRLGGFNLGSLGFQESELRTMARKAIPGGTDPDDVPAAPKKPVTKLGDIWLLGEHRLRCGDSTTQADVDACLDGARPHLMVTDPPYGVNYDADWRNKAERADGTKIGASAVGKVQNDDKADWSEAWALFPGTVCYIWHAALRAGVVWQSLIAAGFQIRAQIVWVKTRPVLGRGNYHWQHEPSWYATRGKDQDQVEHWQPHFEPMHELAEYAVKDGARSDYDGGRKQSTVWMIEHTRSETGHSTQKPVEAMRRPIINNSKPGDFVYDPFTGSGTTLIACEMEARKARCIELNPVYCDVIAKRWEDFTGKKGTRLPAKAAAK